MGKKLEDNVSTETVTGSVTYPNFWTGSVTTQTEYSPSIKTVTTQVSGIVVNDAEVVKPSHYDNSNGSLYKFCEDKNLNSYEFEVIKRIVRCRKKGEFISDLEKTKAVIDIYLNEQGHLFKGQIEKLNK